MDTVISDEVALRRISDNVNRLLTAAGMSRYRLAKLTGENEVMIKSVADGAHMPRVSILARIAEALGVTVDDLLQPVEKLAPKKSSKKLRQVASSA